MNAPDPTNAPAAQPEYTKVSIDNRDTAYTIDTYTYFDGNDAYEREVEYFTGRYSPEDQPEDMKAAGVTYDNFDEKVEWSFDHPAYVKHLAQSSVDILKDIFVTSGTSYADMIPGEVVKDITLDESRSPAFYNYTTDSYKAIWTIDRDALEKFIKERQGAYNSFESENWRTVYLNHGTEDHNEEDYTVAMLDYYTRERYDDESYINTMYEVEQAEEFYTWTIKANKKGGPKNA